MNIILTTTTKKKIQQHHVMRLVGHTHPHPDPPTPRPTHTPWSANHKGEGGEKNSTQTLKADNSATHHCSVEYGSAKGKRVWAKFSVSGAAVSQNGYDC